MRGSITIHKFAAHCDQRPFGTNIVQQFTARQLAKQPGDTTRSQNETYICLRPFLIGKISGNIVAEASQCGRKEKVDAVEAVEARTGNWEICSTQ